MRVKTTKTEKSLQQVPWSKSIASSSFCPRHSIAEKERKKKCMIPSCLLITFSRSYANARNEWSLQFRPSWRRRQQLACDHYYAYFIRSLAVRRLLDARKLFTYLLLSSLLLLLWWSVVQCPVGGTVKQSDRSRAVFIVIANYFFTAAVGEESRVVGGSFFSSVVLQCRLLIVAHWPSCARHSVLVFHFFLSFIFRLVCSVYGHTGFVHKFRSGPSWFHWRKHVRSTHARMHAPVLARSLARSEQQTIIDGNSNRKVGPFQHRCSANFTRCVCSVILYLVVAVAVSFLFYSILLLLREWRE